MKKNNIRNYVVDKEAKRGVRYVGEYYVTDIPDEKRRRDGALQLLFGFGQIIAVFAALMIPSIGSVTVYVIIPLECILFCAMAYISGSYAFMRSDAKIEQKIYDRAYGNRIQVITVAIVFNSVSFLGQLFVIIKKSPGFGDYFLLAIITVMLLLHIIVWRYHKKLLGLVRPEKTSTVSR